MIENEIFPKKELKFEEITVNDIINKINSFYERLEKRKDYFADLAEGYFLELLHKYPKSMCCYVMTDTLKLVIALWYFKSKPSEQEIKKEIQENKKIGIKMNPYLGESFEDLSLIFDRSKASIHSAVLQKETEVKELLREFELRQLAKKAVFEEMKEQEKQRLLNEGVNINEA